jgi:hypothetical protein
LGRSSRKSFFKWLLILLSILGVAPLPVAVYYRVDSSDALLMLRALAAWSVLLFVTTLIAFAYINTTPSKQRVPEGWRES